MFLGDYSCRRACIGTHGMEARTLVLDGAHYSPPVQADQEDGNGAPLGIVHLKEGKAGAGALVFRNLERVGNAGIYMWPRANTLMTAAVPIGLYALLGTEMSWAMMATQMHERRSQ